MLEVAISSLDVEVVSTERRKDKIITQKYVTEIFVHR
jgi:hypothetical protein